jgi:protein-disulfide isomerase
LRPAVFAEVAAKGRRLGPEDAPVVIVVYSAYACGHCAEFESTLVRLRRQYPDHLAVVMKHFVPTAVRTDIEAHEAAECAGEQGKFDEFNQVYFRIGQTRIAREPWREIGDSIGIANRTDFATCVRSGQFSKLIGSDTEEGVRLGVAGTPTSFVNGTRVVGTVSFEALERFVAEQLGRSPKKGL